MSNLRSRNPKKTPITRVNKFFSQEDFNLEIDMGREYIEGDIDFVVVLYRVDKKKSSTDDLYGETLSHELRTLPPVELSVNLTLEPSTPKSYLANGSLRYEEYGNLTFTIYEQQLEEKHVEIHYGDYIGYPDTETNFKFFEVVDDNAVNSDNAKTIAGFKKFYRTIKCIPADPDQFLGI